MVFDLFLQGYCFFPEFAAVLFEELVAVLFSEFAVAFFEELVAVLF